MLSKQELNLICRKLMLPKASGLYSDYYLYSYDKVEIIGNIFENPELLKETI